MSIMNDLCRVCLIPLINDDALSIFLELQPHTTILQELVNFASLEVENEDKLPQFVCFKCKEQLVNVNNFRCTIVKSDEYLKKKLIDSKNDIENEDLDFKNETIMEADDIVSTTYSSDTNCLNEKKSARKPIYECKECNKKFKKKYLYDVHNTTHTGIKPHICTVCNKGFSMKWALKVHYRAHTGEKPYHCKICNKFYGSPSSFAIHKRIHKEVKTHVCDICGKGFNQIGQLKTHMRSHTGEKPFMCDTCSKTFTDASGLRRHFLKHNPKVPEPCPICEKLCSTLTLRAHIKAHLSEKRFQCDRCIQKFTTNGGLKRHMRIHDGIKPFKCSRCEKSFTQSGILMRHMRVHSGETPYPCLICPKQFAYKQHLQSHVKRYHPDSASYESSK